MFHTQHQRIMKDMDIGAILVVSRKVIGCASSKIDFMRFPHPPEGMGLQCASFWEPLIEFCIFLDQEEEQAQSANPNHSSLIIH